MQRSRAACAAPNMGRATTSSALVRKWAGLPPRPAHGWRRGRRGRPAARPARAWCCSTAGRTPGTPPSRSRRRSGCDAVNPHTHTPPHRPGHHLTGCDVVTVGIVARAPALEPPPRPCRAWPLCTRRAGGRSGPGHGVQSFTVTPSRAEMGATGAAATAVTRASRCLQCSLGMGGTEVAASWQSQSVRPSQSAAME